MAQMYPIDTERLLKLQDKETALAELTRIFQEEIMDQLDDMDDNGLIVDKQVIEGFRQELLQELSAHRGPEVQIYQEAVERAIIRIHGIRQTSH